MEVERRVAAQRSIGGLSFLVLVGESDLEQVVDYFGFLLFFLLHQTSTKYLPTFS